MATNSARETRELELALKRAVKEKGTRTVDAAEQEALRQLLSKALRSCSPAVAETALVLCSPDSTADKSPLPPPACLEILTQAWPGSPVAVLPLVAGAVARQLRDMSAVAAASTLLRMANARPDAAMDIVDAVVAEIRGAGPRESDKVVRWQTFRVFVAGVLLAGRTRCGSDAAGGELPFRDSTYVRVQLHRALVDTLGALDCFAPGVLDLAPFYEPAGAREVPADATVSKHWVATVARQCLDARVCQWRVAELCLHHALELSLAGESALSTLGMLGAVCDKAATAELLPDADLGCVHRICYCAGALLALLGLAAEKVVLLGWLLQLTSHHSLVGHLDAPLLAFLLVGSLREQYTHVEANGPAQGVATAAGALAHALDGALRSGPTGGSGGSSASGAGSVDPTTMQLVPSPFQRTLSDVRQFLRLWNSAAASTAGLDDVIIRPGQTCGGDGGSGPAVGAMGTVVDVCVAALTFHPQPAIRAAAARFLQQQPGDIDGGGGGRLGPGADGGPRPQVAAAEMTYLPTVLFRLRESNEQLAPLQCQLLHAIPALGTGKKAGAAALRFLRQLLAAGGLHDLCTVLLLRLWEAAQFESNRMATFDALTGALKAAVG